MNLALVVVVCLAAGAALGWLAASQRSTARTARLQALLDAATAGEERLERSLRALSHEAARESRDSLSEVVAPLEESLRILSAEAASMERDRVGAYAELRSQVRQMHATAERLGDSAGKLVGALRSPSVRGRWGEHQLRRVVEAAGMVEHCDFTEQASATVAGEEHDQLVRPDLVVHLAGGKHLVVDAKAPLEGYLAAMEARDDTTRDAKLDRHARHLRGHVDALAAKSYWAAFDPAPELVVLFVPADTFLDAALRRDPMLLEHGFARNVVIATPATLVALLRTVAHAWRAEGLARNAAEVHRLGRELYARLATTGTHLTRLGASLSSSVLAYNKAVGSMETRVLVTARKLAELGISTDDLDELPQIELAPRQPQSPELTT